MRHRPTTLPARLRICSIGQVGNGFKLPPRRAPFLDCDRVLCVPLDVAHGSQSTEAVAQVIHRFGRIDVLVNNAGDGQLGLFEEVPSPAIEAQFQTNVFGLMHVTRAALPHMRRQRSGHIFNLASIGGFMGFASSSIYCATKFAVEGFSESLALEVSRFGIHVTIVEPGNPAKLGQTLVQIAAWDRPPLRFLAGSDAVAYARETFDRRRAEIAEHAALSSSTDFAAR